MPSCRANEWSTLRALLDGEHSGAYYFVVYKLDADGLLEHGTTINCSWPTDDGIAALNLLHEWDEERRKGGSK